MHLLHGLLHVCCMFVAWKNPSLVRVLSSEAAWAGVSAVDCSHEAEGALNDRCRRLLWRMLLNHISYTVDCAPVGTTD